jgi:alkanesulfonate monooxygenase SsuD/methylene tetrahydromethanopterin reductase-like flavin-dependent oxidoreductase (luciferase family)
VPEVPVPISLAALSPGSIRVAGELADAWTPFLWARSRVGEGRALLAEGAARTGAVDGGTSVAVGVPVALAPDEDRSRRLAAWWLSTYATRMGPLYPRMLAERFGMAAGVEAMIECDPSGRQQPGLPAAAESLASEVTMMGTFDEAGGAISSWFEAGADSVQLVLPPTLAEEELAEIVRVAARAGAAGVRAAA